MIRSLSFLVPDKRWVKNPCNSPLMTPGQRMGVAAQTLKINLSVKAALAEYFGAPPSQTIDDRGCAVANHWRAKLTRISPGTLDPGATGSALKAFQDALAEWCGVKDERKPIWTWVEPYGQEKAGKGVYGVRIELEDLAPGKPRIVCLQQIKIVKPPKREKKAKKTWGLLVQKVGRGQGMTREAQAQFARGVLGPGGDDEKSPRQLKPCPRASCFVALDLPCRLLPGELVVCGVHAERAQAAGVEGIALPHPRPSEAKGSRRDVPSGPRPLPVFVVLPWKQKICDLCDGVIPEACPECKGSGRRRAESLTLEPRVDGRSAPRCLRYRVPGEHVARFGGEVVLWPAREPVGGVDAVVFREGKRG